MAVWKCVTYFSPSKMTHGWVSVESLLQKTPFRGVLVLQGPLEVMWFNLSPKEEIRPQCLQQMSRNRSSWPLKRASPIMRQSYLSRFFLLLNQDLHLLSTPTGQKRKHISLFQLSPPHPRNPGHCWSKKKRGPLASLEYGEPIPTHGCMWRMTSCQGVRNNKIS